VESVVGGGFRDWDLRAEGGGFSTMVEIAGWWLRVDPKSVLVVISER